MGWGNIFGELAKNFAEGYIEERGTKGTLEDLGNLARSAKNFFTGSDSDNDVELERAVEQLNALEEEGNYSDAMDLLDSIYEGCEPDSQYYFRAARIATGCLETLVGDDDFKEIYSLSCDLIYKGKALNDSDYKGAFRELASRVARANDSHSMAITNAKREALKSEVADNSENEIQYVEEVKACLADDGIITERERRLLQRLATSLGISEERAKELEQSCSPDSLTDDEQEYADEIRACLKDDGKITDRERRLLDRLRKSLNISESRASEIESIISKAL